MAETMKILNLGAGAHPIEGADNLDKVLGWLFESGLADYSDETVDGVSISHALMFVKLEHWPFVFSECARVLKPGGVLRVTEDSTDDPKSSRYGGFQNPATLTSETLVQRHMERAGLEVVSVDSAESHFQDDRLIQSWHGPVPKVFFLEAVKR